MNYSKRWKEVEDGAEDIISGLPRNIVDSILELMPMRDAARTSILSRKWRYIWSSHPKLVLDKDYFSKTCKNQTSLFERLTNKLLFLHTGPILKSSLYVPKGYFVQTGLIDNWILFLSSNGIKELTIDNADTSTYQLPCRIFSFTELNYLTLSNCVFKLPHHSGGFSNLISLELTRTSFVANSIGTQVFSAPLLESLKFAICNNIHHFKVSAPKLKDFHALDSYGAEFICFRNMSNLEIVNIKLGKEVGNREQGFINIFGDLPRVRRISFDGFLRKLLAAGTVPRRLPTTANHLISLDLHNLEFNDVHEISSTLCLLRSSPNLTWLNIYVGQVNQDINQPRQAVAITGIAALLNLETQDPMDQILNKLQTVKIFSSTGSTSELLFIRLLLACSPSLEKLFIQRCKAVYGKEEFKISSQLMRFPRASTRAELIYLDPDEKVQ